MSNHVTVEQLPDGRIGIDQVHSLVGQGFGGHYEVLPTSTLSDAETGPEDTAARTAEAAPYAGAMSLDELLEMETQ